MEASDRTTASGLVTDMASLPGLAGRDLGHTDWREMTQATVDAFADVTGDHQYIHVDPVRARETPFGGTIAHGYLTLSLLAPILFELLTVRDAAMGVNYGLDRLRFPAPLPVGARYRGRAKIAQVTSVEGGVQIKIDATIEVEGASKPSLVAECIIRYYA